MKGVFLFLVNFFTDGRADEIVNVPLLIITVSILLIALWICIGISKKNRLYIRQKKDEKDNAYT